MALREYVLVTLQGKRRAEFLLNLDYEFSMLERTLYRSDREVVNPLSLAAYCNESRLVIQKQLRTDILGKGNGYPDEALEAILTEKAQQVQAMAAWSNLVARAAPWWQV